MFSNNIFYLIFFVLPLTDIFIFNNKYPIAIYFSFLLAIIYTIINLFIKSNYRFKINNKLYYYIIILLITLLIFIYILRPTGARSFHYFLWFLNIYVIYGCFLKFYIDNINLNNINSNFINYVLLFYSSLSIYDWVVINDFISLPSIFNSLGRLDNEFSSRLLGYIRLRGPTEEGALYGLFINMYFPLILAFGAMKGYKLFFSTIIILISYLLTASLSSWIFLIFALIISIFIMYKYLDNKLVIIAFFLLLTMYATYSYDLFDNEILNRLKNPEDVSIVERSGIYMIALDGIRNFNLPELFLGMGIANFRDSNGTNPISWYLMVAHDLGFVSFFLVVCLFLYVISKILNSKLNTKQKFYSVVAVICSLMHYGFVGNFWHPWVWFLFAYLLGQVNLSFFDKNNECRT